MHYYEFNKLPISMANPPIAAIIFNLKSFCTKMNKKIAKQNIIVIGSSNKFLLDIEKNLRHPITIRNIEENDFSCILLI